MLRSTYEKTFQLSVIWVQRGSISIFARDRGRNIKKTAIFGIGFAAILIAGIFCSEASAGVRIAVIDSGARGYVDAAISFTSYSGYQDPLNHGTEIFSTR